MSNKKTNGNEICMLCGEWKEEKSLICRNCFNAWLAEWEKDEETPLIVWTFQKAEICCTLIDEQLEKMRKTFVEFHGRIQQQAYDKVNMALQGIKVSGFLICLRENDKDYGKKETAISFMAS